MRWVWFDEVSSLPDGWWDKVEAVLKLKYQSYFLDRAIGHCDLDRFAGQLFLTPDEVRRAFELSLGICQEKRGNMSDKVVIEGKLSNWQSSPLHVGISVNDPTVEGDWAALSGRCVRVTVEQVKVSSDDRCAACHLRGTESCGIMPVSAPKSNGVICIRGFWFDAGFVPETVKAPEPRCPFCGGEIKIDEELTGNDGWETELVMQCMVCGACGKGDTHQVALDALKAWQPPEPKCPHCGREVQVVRDRGGGVYFGDEQKDIISPHIAHCACGAHGEGKTRQAALGALAEWLAPCPRCGGKAEYRAQCNEEGTPNGWWRVRCMTDECKIVSPVFLVKAFAGRWWNKRAGRHG